ncbi:hypothetical protein [Saccharothrix sp. HUAS TT1]|uniref:hypothetical protein n=1 Tax=unclassified Saccharothrix TaxID=2593673 RepID=UPI00345B5439
MRLLVVAGVLLLAACESATPPAAPSSTAPATAAGEAGVLDSGGIGAVRLGMTVERLRATGEVGDDVTTLEFSCPVHELVAVRGWVGVQDGVAVDIRVESAARTPEGLRIGDSRDRMREVYPDVEQTPHSFVRVLDAATRYQFFFRDAGDTLTGMGLTKEGHGCLN